MLKAVELRAGGDLHLCCTVGLSGIPAGCDWIRLHPLAACNKSPAVNWQPNVRNLAKSWDFASAFIFMFLYI